MLELADKEQWKLSEDQKGIEKRGTLGGSRQKDITKRNNDFLASLQKFHKRA